MSIFYNSKMVETEGSVFKKELTVPDKFGLPIKVGDHVLYITTGMDAHCFRGVCLAVRVKGLKQPRLYIKTYQWVDQDWDPDKKEFGSRQCQLGDHYYATSKSCVNVQGYIPPDHQCDRSLEELKKTMIKVSWRGKQRIETPIDFTSY